MRLFFRLRFSLLSIAVLLLLVVTIAAMTTAARSKVAHAAPGECKVVIIIDKSASVGDNWSVLRGQVLNLFDPASGLYRGDISLAFWTFSNVTNPEPGVNYNAPFHSYVRSNDPLGKNAFESSLPVSAEDVLTGQTNYEQGFGFNQGVANSLGGIDDIRSEANVVAFLTDGAPNYPGGFDGNAQAVAAGQAARDNYPQSVGIIGGYVSPDDNSTYVPLSLYRTINGNDDTSADNVGPLGFNSLTEYLVPRIKAACDIDIPDYSLTPVVNVDNVAVQSGDTVNFNYSVNNETSEGTSGNSGWQLYDVTIDPSVQGNPLIFNGGQSACTGGGGRPYCNSVANCAQILAMVGNRGTCNAVPSGGRGLCGQTPSTSPGTGSNTFASGPNAFYNPPRCVTIDDLPLGTRICSILALASPTATGSVNRISSASCVTIGKTPLVQVHGGDVRVGRNFVGDSTASEDAGVFTSRFKVSGDPAIVPNGRTFGSWVEYGIVAPGSIQRVASLSGYAGPNGGYDGSLVTAGCDLGVNKLTFANVVTAQGHENECGYSPDSSGLIPDMISSLTSPTPIDPTLYSSPLLLGAGSHTGLYKSAQPNFEIGDSTLTKGAGKTYVVYVPDGTVTIAGNIQYDTADTYNDIRDIPQLVIIAKNIKINEGVTRVDAWLVAAGRGDSEGMLETCANYAAPLRATVCNQPLRINGPVMARELKLWRTKVDMSNPACKITTDIDDCHAVGDPAEVLNLAGSSVLWAKAYGLHSVRAQTSYTTELPPYF